jgi:FMN phosphatase YigB (HAD superfamily)
VLFLDDGGVLSDNERRAGEWRRHLGAFLARELGGDPAAWAAANVPAVERAWACWQEAARRAEKVHLAMREYDLVWLRDMAARVGATLPADEDRVIELTRRTSRYVTERVRAFYPDVAPALRALRAGGHTLHTASGAVSADLEGYLRAERARDLFGTLYGVDIVDTWKASPDYYVAIFAHAGVKASAAIVVDDSRDAVGWARLTGAKAFLLSRDGGGDLRLLADLVRALASRRLLD